jgi:Ion transport protein/Cyclic nucleotide-binding domain
VDFSRTISEDSPGRRLWDFLSLSLILVSCILVPFMIVFQGKPFGSGVVVLYAIDCFFFADIWLNFRTTFRHNGTEISDRKKISAHYLKTFFPIDLLASVPFELLFVFHSEAAAGTVSLIVLIRILRLLRVSRMYLIFNRWQNTGWMNPSGLRIARFLTLITLLIHLLACMWFQVAAIEDYPKDSWVVLSGIKDAEVSSQYIRALYWTITTMTTIGYGDITPSRDLEYIVAMVIMLLGASMYAFIIGNVASLLNHLDYGKANHWQRMETVTEYLRSRQVPKTLVARIRAFYEYLWTKHKGVPRDTIISDLPESLRLEVLLSLARELLENVPLFKYCQPPLRNALLIALKPHTFDPGSHVVREGDVGKQIFFISKGRTKIIKEPDQNIDVLQNGDYFGHMSILLGERRTASVVATTYCEIFELSKRSYDEVAQRHPELKEIMKKMSSEASEKLANLILKDVVL